MSEVGRTLDGCATFDRINFNTGLRGGMVAHRGLLINCLTNKSRRVHLALVSCQEGKL